MNAEQERADFEAWYEKRMGESPRMAVDIYTPFAAACWEAYQEGRAALQSQDREDAERYRWLRNRASDEGICVVHIDYWIDDHRGQAHCEIYDGEFLDKAIEAARRAEGVGNE